ncbi:TraB/GumN family protein [Aurantiacibacter poecillastricola]|uniref:TraB/GumN family protein n=1 Tax=Aurantiacibacter poecillastricola TaxID=3064385 RepID=UPI00273E82BC|nr:TraB/GumN family protein [Aurantiacibacter sp. 219JJ12-13]MDP5262056.1 TraB/GumN family protein [Aurantiacibacter sp. 219JJ12-13]
MFRKRILAASTLALALAATPAHADNHEGEVTGPAMWQVSDEDTTVYLFGTVHFLPEGVDWFTPVIEEALARSYEFVTEIDTSAIPEVVPGETPPPELMAIAQMQMQMAQLTVGSTLREMMSEEDREQYEAAMTEFGLPPAAFDGFEPWFAFMNLSQLALVQQGLDPSAGVERTLDRMVEGKERDALETIEQQIGFLDGLPMDAQVTLLDETVEGLPRMGESLQRMVDEWMAGDADGLARIMNEEMTSEVLYEALLTRRNADWAEWIETRMDEPGTVFIAVGAGHLAGEGSVQEMLAERGLTAERVGN